MRFSIGDRIVFLAFANDGCILYRDLFKLLEEEGITRATVYETVKRLKRAGIVYTKYSTKGKWVSEKEVCVRVQPFLVRSAQRLLKLAEG